MNEPITVPVPGDKSISHRALILSSLARGESAIRGILTGADTRSTAAVLRRLGCTVPPLRADRVVRVAGLGRRGWQPAEHRLNCGNSGTTARLLLGALAAHPFRSVLTGDASLRSRPMRRVTAPLATVGARFEELGRPDRLPVAVHGGDLLPIDHHASQASAQVKSALLLAAFNSGVPARLHEPYLSRDHTERMLRAMGMRVDSRALDDGSAAVAVDAQESLDPLDLTVPGDCSSAAFFIALGLAGSRAVRVPGIGLNPTRTGFLAVVRRMGGSVRIENERDEGGEPVGDALAFPSALRGTTVTSEEVPSLIDEIPILMVLGAVADGETTVRGAAELRVKESDRLAVLTNNLRVLGADAEEFADGMTVRGTDTPLRGRIQVHADHRIAMAFAVLGALRGAAVEIDDPQAADVSFPTFWSSLRHVMEAR